MVSLYPHQELALSKLDNGKILCGDTGVGKSLTALAYWYLSVCGGDLNTRTVMAKPTDLYIITTPKKRDSLDWNGDLAKFGVGVENPEHSVGHVNVVVDSWNNAYKYKDVKDAFFIFDEQRVVGSGAWTGSFIKIAKSNGWILLSATPGDTWLDYIPVFVANGFYKNRTAFKREHVIYAPYTKFPKVDRYIGVGKLVRLRNQILVEMPFERHTKKHFHMVEVDHDQDLFKRVWTDRWHVFENRPLRDVAELFRVMRKVVNSADSRLQAVRELSTRHPRLIVFYNFDYELEALRTLGGSSSPKTSQSLSQISDSTTGPSTSSTLGSTQSDVSPKCGQRAPYMKHHTGLCVLEPHGPETDHLIEMVTEDLPKTDYSRSSENVRTAPELTTEFSTESPGRTSTPRDPAGSRRTGPEPTLQSARSEKPSESSESSTLESAGSSDAAIQGASLSVAEWNGHKHEPIPNTDRWIYLVQYTSGSEGWNCVETDAVVFYSLTYSYKQFYQAQGRIDRLNTQFVDLHYYILRSKALIDRMIWKNLSQKRSFNERSAKISWPESKAA